jgi:hypothetical protein
LGRGRFLSFGDGFRSPLGLSVFKQFIFIKERVGSRPESSNFASKRFIVRR